jgi:hypothetical protein
LVDRLFVELRQALKSLPCGSKAFGERLEHGNRGSRSVRSLLRRNVRSLLRRDVNRPSGRMPSLDRWSVGGGLAWLRAASQP